MLKLLGTMSKGHNSWGPWLTNNVSSYCINSWWSPLGVRTLWNDLPSNKYSGSWNRLAQWEATSWTTSFTWYIRRWCKTTAHIQHMYILSSLSNKSHMHMHWLYIHHACTVLSLINVLQLEKYSTNLEAVVAERTQELANEKAKTDELVCRKLS